MPLQGMQKLKMIGVLARPHLAKGKKKAFSFDYDYEFGLKSKQQTIVRSDIQFIRVHPIPQIRKELWCLFN